MAMEIGLFPNEVESSFDVDLAAVEETCDIEQRQKMEHSAVSEIPTGDTPFRLEDLPTGRPEGSGGIRDGAVFVLGVDEMSTDDIKAVFKVHSPKTVEWINDTSCLIVWNRASLAVEALFAVGKWPLPPPVSTSGDEMSCESRSTTFSTNGSDSSRDSGVATEDGESLDWRVAQPNSEKAKFLLLRRATDGDRKKRGAAKESTYYVKHGNPHTGQRGAVSLDDLRNRARKRRHQTGESEDKPKEGRSLASRLGKREPPQPSEAPERLTITIDNESEDSDEEMDVDEDAPPRKMPSSVIAVKPIVSASSPKHRMRLHADDDAPRHRMRLHADDDAPRHRMRLHADDDVPTHRMRLYADDGVSSRDGSQPMEVDSGLSITVDNDDSDLRGRLSSRRSRDDSRGRLRDDSRSWQREESRSSRMRIDRDSDGRSIAVKRNTNKGTGLVVKIR